MAPPIKVSYGLTYAVGVVYMMSVITQNFYGALAGPVIKRPDLYKKALESGEIPPEAKHIEFVKRNTFSL